MNKLFIICGIPFAGKSTLGQVISELFAYNKVDLDETKFNLFGVDIKDDDLSKADWDRVYDETYKLIERYLKSGKTVIHDSGNFTRHERQLARQIADKLGIDIITIYVDTPEVIARQRLLENRKTKVRFDVTDKAFKEAIQEMEVPTSDENPLVFHNNDSIDRWILKHISNKLD